MGEIKILLEKEKIQKRVEGLAKEIKKDFKNEVYCVVVLKGAIVFFVDLMRELKKLGLSVKFGFIKLSSYDGEESSGKINVDLDINEIGENILIVEDIIDTGLTLDFLKEHLIKKGGKKVKICSLLDKKERRKIEIKIDYVGFEIPDKFIFGYGIDVGGEYRDLDYVGYLEN